MKKAYPQQLLYQAFFVTSHNPWSSIDILVQRIVALQLEPWSHDLFVFLVNSWLIFKRVKFLSAFLFLCISGRYYITANNKLLYGYCGERFIFSCPLLVLPNRFLSIAATSNFSLVTKSKGGLNWLNSYIRVDAVQLFDLCLQDIFSVYLILSSCFFLNPIFSQNRLKLDRV